MASFPGRPVPSTKDDALLNELPAIEVDELVTKTFLRAELETAMHAQTQRLMTIILSVMSVQTAVFAVIVALLR
jgi:hypothetical protein